MTPTGLDQSWGYADPAAAAKAGVLVVSEYLSWDSSKNITAADVKAYHGHGIAMLLNWESQAGAPLKGAAQGKADATEAVRQAKALIKAVGTAPRNRVVLYFSCDRDVTGTQIRGPVAAYYKAARTVCHAAGFGVGPYGEAALVHYLAAQKISDAEWQTYAWSGGALDPAADFYQYNNGQTLGGASVDFDKVIHPAALGAWWPAGHRYDRPAAKPAPAPATAATKPAPTVQHKPAVITTSEDPVAFIVKVDQKDCARLKVPWPGFFFDNGGMAPRYIATPAELHARIAEGFPVKTLTVAQARAIGVK